MFKALSFDDEGLKLPVVWGFRCTGRACCGSNTTVAKTTRRHAASAPMVKCSEDNHSSKKKRKKKSKNNKTNSVAVPRGEIATARTHLASATLWLEGHLNLKSLVETSPQHQHAAQRIAQFDSK